MDLPKTIAKLRKEQKISQEEMARRIAVSFRTYQRIESGESALRIEVAFRIFNELRVDPTPIFLSYFKDMEVAARDPNAPPPPGHIQVKWSNNISEEPLMASNIEIEGIKRSLTHDYERGIGSIGYWEWNLGTQAFYWSSKMYEIYEIEPSDNFSVEEFQAKLAPGHLERLNQDLDLLIKENKPYLNVHEMTSPNGPNFKVRAHAKLFKNAKGETIIFGIAERI